MIKARSCKSTPEFDIEVTLTISVRVNEKNTILTPFTIIDKLTSPYAFSRTSKETLADKMELYFHDFSFVPLFMQVRIQLMTLILDGN
ncbi:MAG: hypothetical protein EOO38_08465 [Cytophagaceae bacterium]|nr:MAG: hypothetical protein EOO38_08465 [Cytophagaceae bacterium]